MCWFPNNVMDTFVLLISFCLVSCNGDAEMTKFEVTGSLTTENGPGGGTVQRFSCNDVRCELQLLSNVAVTRQGCVRIQGEIHSREFGAGFHVSIVGSALQRVHVQTTGLHTHALQPVRMCWPGKYTMRFRLDYLWNQGFENCTTPPNSVLGGVTPPLFMTQSTIQFEVASSQDVLSHVKTGRPQWVHLGCDKSDAGSQAGDLIQRACAELKQKNDTWAWLPALQRNMFTSQGFASTVIKLPLKHPKHDLSSYWMHWVGDSISLRGPMVVLFSILDNLAQKTSGENRTLMCSRSSLKFSPSAFESCVDGLDITQGLRGVGRRLNLWSWNLQSSTIHVSFLPSTGMEHQGTLADAKRHLGQDPDVSILNLGLHLVAHSLTDTKITARFADAIRAVEQESRAKLSSQPSLVVWQRITMTHFESGDQDDYCRSAQKIYALDQRAMSTVKNNSFTLPVWDMLSISESRPDGVHDNRHYLPEYSNVPFHAVGELLHILKIEREKSQKLPEIGVLVHVAKTGGTTATKIFGELLSQTPDSNTHHNCGQRTTGTHPFMTPYTRAMDTCKFVQHEWPIRSFKNLTALTSHRTLRYITLVRDPAQWVVSACNHMQRKHEAYDMPCANLLESRRGYFRRRNFQYGRVIEDFRRESIDEQLAEYAFVGITEFYRASMCMFKYAFNVPGWFTCECTAESAVVLNAKPKTKSPPLISEVEINNFLKNNSDDQLLHTRALILFRANVRVFERATGRECKLEMN